MPGVSKTGWAQLKVGLMAIAAMAILGFLIFLMSGVRGIFQTKTEVYTYLDDSQAVADGSDVRLNGILIGRVAHVDLSGSSDPNRIVKVTLQIDNKFLSSVPVDSTAGLAAANLLGTKFINIKKGKSPQAIQAGAEIASGETPELEDLFQQGSTALGALQQILTRMDGIISSVEVGKGTIGKLFVDETIYNNLVAITGEFQKLVSTLNTTVNSTDNSIGSVLHDNNALYSQVQGSLTRINSLLDGISNGEGTAGKFIKDPALYDDSRQAIADMRKILQDIDSGQGTLGKLLKSDEMHEQVKTTIAHLDSILEKINSGQGTLGQLLVNPQLYESLDGTMRETQGLIKDFRANPKKFLRIKIGLF